MKKRLSGLGAVFAVTGLLAGAATSSQAKASKHIQATAIQQAVLALPDRLPKKFSVSLPIDGQNWTLQLEKNSVFGKNTRFLVADATGHLKQIDPGPDRSYLGRIAERNDFTVSAVLTEQGLLANIGRPGAAPMVITPLPNGSSPSLHSISIGDTGDFSSEQPLTKTARMYWNTN